MSKRSKRRRQQVRQQQRRRASGTDLAAGRTDGATRGTPPSEAGETARRTASRRPPPAADLGHGPATPPASAAPAAPAPLLLTVEQAAAMLGVSRATFYRLGQPGKVTLPTGAVRYRVSDLQTYVAGLDDRRGV